MSLLPSRTQLVLLELSLAAAVVGAVRGGAWLVLGIVLAVGCLALAFVPVGRRRLYLVLRSLMGMRARRRGVRGTGIASLVGGSYDVVTVPRGSGGVSVGAVSDGATWTVALALPLSGLVNDDAPIPVERLATLLMIEDVPLSSVRIVTLVVPTSASAGVPAGAPPIAARASRYLALTLDTAHAAGVLSARGGAPAVQQVLRRCVLRAEEVLSASGVATRRLSAAEMQALSAEVVGPMSPAPDGTHATAAETTGQVTIADTASMTVAVTGRDALARLDHVVASLGGPFIATSVALQPGSGPKGSPTLRLLVRLSGPAAVVRSSAQVLQQVTRAQGLVLHRLAGEQLPMLRTTTLLGVPAGRS